VWSGEIRQRLERRWVIGDDDNLTALIELRRHEPSIWHLSGRTNRQRSVEHEAESVSARLRRCH
jgi:hypothetical protein